MFIIIIKVAAQSDKDNTQIVHLVRYEFMIRVAATIIRWSKEDSSVVEFGLDERVVSRQRNMLVTNMLVIQSAQTFLKNDKIGLCADICDNHFKTHRFVCLVFSLDSTQNDRAFILNPE